MSENSVIKCDVNCIWDAKAILGESPCWHAKSDQLFWLDIKSKVLNSIFPKNGQKRSWPLQMTVGSVAVPPSDWSTPDITCDFIFLAGAECGFCWLLISGNEVQILPIHDPEPNLPQNRFNDGKVGPDGCFYAGTMDDNEREQTGSLYRLDSTLSVTKLDGGYGVTNGPTFFRNKMYHSDSAAQKIYSFEDKEGSFSSKSVFKQFSEDQGFPDGMTVDGDGNLWVAMWGAGCVKKIGPDGVTQGRVPIPVSRVTSCTFVGNAFDRLYITTASIGADVEKEPLAGALFELTF